MALVSAFFISMDHLGITWGSPGEGVTLIISCLPPGGLNLDNAPESQADSFTLLCALIAATVNWLVKTVSLTCCLGHIRRLASAGHGLPH